MTRRDYAENLAARRIMNTLQTTRAEAFRLLHAAKVPECNWGQAADAVLLEQAGPGLPDIEGDA